MKTTFQVEIANINISKRETRVIFREQDGTVDQAARLGMSISIDDPAGLVVGQKYTFTLRPTES